MSGQSRGRGIIITTGYGIEKSPRFSEAISASFRGIIAESRKAKIMASFTTIPTVKIKRTDFLGRIGWLFGIERWMYKILPDVVSVTWTKEDHNKLISVNPLDHLVESGKWYEVPLQCTQSEMRHHWWVAYRWENVTELQDTEPVYIRGIPRPIEEADSASKEFHLSRVSRVTSEEAV